MIYYANSKLKKQKLVTWIKKNRTQRYYISMTIQIVLFFIAIGNVLYINAQQDRWYRTGQEAESQVFAPVSE